MNIVGGSSFFEAVFEETSLNSISILNVSAYTTIHLGVKLLLHWKKLERYIKMWYELLCVLYHGLIVNI